MCEQAGRRQLGLCVLCGLPAAGKSSLARSLGSGGSWALVVISYDDIITAEAFPEGLCASHRDTSAGSEELSLWKQNRQHILLYLEHLIAALIGCSALIAPAGRTEGTWSRFVSCLERQGLISSAASDVEHHLITIPENRALYLVLDDNFYYQSMRYEVYQLARKYYLGFCQLYLNCPVESCLLRNQNRPLPLPDKTIVLMEKKIEKPNPERNQWEQNSLILNTSGPIRMEDLRVPDLLNQALENPLSPLQEDSERKDMDREICAASILHQADQSLRRLISETMKTVKELPT
ncbi:hypothetical protein FKM82_014634 [Ascaphus truei]|uniref:L-seryl-tRNA(Sec) kinase isoform X3 n=1 Tax=Ascaphus truei TaxID=8439 RepID=UPI003F592BF6